MQHKYSIYGLRLRCDAPLPALTPDSSGAQADVTVWTRELPEWAARAISGARTARFDSGDGSDASPASARVWRFDESGAFQFAYSDGIRFVVDSTGNRIAIGCSGSSTLSDAATYLVGVILGFVLRLKKRLALHASVVDVDDHAIVILGGSGCGKSTTAASFAAMGYAVLADDVCVPIEQADGFHVEPAYPGIRLWPDSAQGLFGSDTALPRVSPCWEKRLLELSGESHRFQSKRLPIGAMYWLSVARPGESFANVRRLRPSERMTGLLSMSYPRYLLDGDMKADEFDTLGRLACGVAGAEIGVPTSLDAVAHVCRAILDDYRAGVGELPCS